MNGKRRPKIQARENFPRDFRQNPASPEKPHHKEKTGQNIDLEEVLVLLKSQANPENVAGMVRYGINRRNTLGISMPYLRDLAMRIGRNHELALTLWDSDIHEARILASLIDEPSQITIPQMEEWVADFDSWDICDQCCSNLFSKTSFAIDLAHDWSSSSHPFIKRAGFVLMAQLSVHGRTCLDSCFLDFLVLIRREATDPRNFVKKAINWALRQIGKRNMVLRRAALATARQIRQLDSPAARWIAADAIRELESPALQARLQKKSLRVPKRKAQSD